ncbi:fluoride efflux transporter FluC [Microbacterium sp.]|uniref:fluoride efflux transporter FluC n=1 Tax=Microbacterium sp. TaxID=51671 RepID=UPI003C7368D5
MARARWFSPVALVLVIVGGALGVAARAAIVVPLTPALGMHTHPLVVPAATLGINLLGSLLLGFVVGWLDDRHPLARTFLGTGVIGGFTTYSAFAAQSVTTASASPLVGLALIAVSLLGGVLCAAIGLAVGRRVVDRPGEVESAGDAE